MLPHNPGIGAVYVLGLRVVGVPSGEENYKSQCVCKEGGPVVEYRCVDVIALADLRNQLNDIESQECQSNGIDAIAQSVYELMIDVLKLLIQFVYSLS